MKIAGRKRKETCRKRKTRKKRRNVTDVANITQTPPHHHTTTVWKESRQRTMLEDDHAACMQEPASSWHFFKVQRACTTTSHRTTHTHTPTPMVPSVPHWMTCSILQRKLDDYNFFFCTFEIFLLWSSIQCRVNLNYFHSASSPVSRRTWHKTTMANIMREVLDVQRRMYTPNEVALHNCAEDIWLAVFGKVYDLSAFVRKNEGPYLSLPRPCDN